MGGSTSEHALNEKKRHLCLGILAHVDAGKTTLSEAMLYACGEIKKPGRVDHRDAFLDTSYLEKERGITIFSKQARMKWKDLQITLLDTPGHVDFSAEMERTLQVLDYAVLVISGTDGVQGHTETLWKLLENYGIPVFLFVNKMDLEGADHAKILGQLRETLSENCIDFSNPGTDEFYEEAAVCEEALLEKYVEHGSLELPRDLVSPIRTRKLFPCYFGSALRMEGAEELLQGLQIYTTQVEQRDGFAARVYKITRDEQGNRLTHMKITGGELKVRDILTGKEKVNQIRLYSGERFETVDQVSAGEICAVTGPDMTYPGQGIGAEPDFGNGQIEPVLRYAMLFPEETEMISVRNQLRQLEEEDPKLHLVWEEKQRQMYIQPMGEVQLEILKRMIHDRFGLEVRFGEGEVLYRETIRNTVEGVGHFEPLRHYAEVHLLMEPLPPGSGLVFESECSEDKLDLNWQRLVLTHLSEKEFPGVLTGSPITDLKITLVAGRAHPKHTEGGDFRQATYRAVRQGLMQAQSVLLEPCYEYRIELPPDCIGRAMSDIRRMNGEFETLPERAGSAVLAGICPAACMKGYPVELASYTRGRGRISCSFGGYRPCHNPEEVVERIAYNCETDVENTADSVFCAHGSGYVVKWNEVKDHMHLEGVPMQRLRGETDSDREIPDRDVRRQKKSQDFYAEEKELQAIFERTFGPVKRRTESQSVRMIQGENDRRHVAIRERVPVEDYLLVDGYNIIFAWEDLKELSRTSLDAARMKLMDMMCNYQGYMKNHLILVFDAYKVKGNPGSIENFHNICVVYTKEAETADMYIEKTTKQIAGKHRVRVATSDAMEQMIILGHGAARLSARAFREEVEQVNARIREIMEENENDRE